MRNCADLLRPGSITADASVLFSLEKRPNFGLEQTAHRLRCGMRHLESESRLRVRLSRAAAQAECSADFQVESESMSGAVTCHVA